MLLMVLQALFIACLMLTGLAVAFIVVEFGPPLFERAVKFLFFDLWIRR